MSLIYPSSTRLKLATDSLACVERLDIGFVSACRLGSWDFFIAYPGARHRATSAATAVETVVKASSNSCTLRIVGLLLVTVYHQHKEQGLWCEIYVENCDSTHFSSQPLELLNGWISAAYMVIIALSLSFSLSLFSLSLSLSLSLSPDNTITAG